MLLNEFLERSAHTFPDKPALITQEDKLTYKNIDILANRFANALVLSGLREQSRVAVYLENSTESVISIFGILKAGGVFVIINPQIKAPKVEYILNDCQVTGLVTNEKHLKDIHKILPDCPDLENIFISDTTDMEYSGMSDIYPPEKIHSYHEIIQEYPVSKPDVRCIDVDLASLIYTSGSTGSPKGVMLTHHNMVSAANSIIEYLNNTDNDIILNCLPLSFDYGLYQILMAFRFGGSVVLEKSFLYPYRIIELLQKEKITGFPIVPAIAAILLQLQNIDEYSFGDLRYITNTGQALPTDHIKKMRKLFPQTEIFSMYGLTECKRVSYLPPEELDKRPTSVGKAMPNTEVYLVDKKGRKITEPGVIGELVVRGSNVMKGYWNLPEETEKRLRPGDYQGEKVLYTGDLFKRDEEGFLYFISRTDDIIKSGGQMVSPREVEDVIYQLNEVVESAVVSVPDDILGLSIKVLVSLKEGSRLTEKDIIAHCAERLEPHMLPKYVEICSELPKTTSGKIRRY